MTDNSISNKNRYILVFTPLQKRLIEILGNIDPLLSNIFIGILKVVSDVENPDRFHQAANSIRGITDILSRNAKEALTIGSNKYTNEEQQEALDKLRVCFDKALTLMPIFSEDEKQAQNNLVESEYKDIEETLKNGGFTLKQRLKRYLGSYEDLSKMPESFRKRIKDTISLWDKAHDYFIGLSHYNSKNIDEEKFRKNWQVIQDCLFYALSPFFEEISVLDEILKMETPPNE